MTGSLQINTTALHTADVEPVATRNSPPPGSIITSMHGREEKPVANTDEINDANGMIHDQSLNPSVSVTERTSDSLSFEPQPTLEAPREGSESPPYEPSLDLVRSESPPYEPSLGPEDAPEEELDSRMEIDDDAKEGEILENSVEMDVDSDIEDDMHSLNDDTLETPPEKSVTVSQAESNPLSIITGVDALIHTTVHPTVTAEHRPLSSPASILSPRPEKEELVVSFPVNVANVNKRLSDAISQSDTKVSLLLPPYSSPTD